ncbi:excinuclease ABC subunit A [bacterium]|nr:excinuclease ABC subunit A [bacterium]|tara:strand:- start:21452 stop:24274 length:2823 start_codon:yes stop_codon:yes gene_type:complete
MKNIIIKGARENNLANINLKIPRDKLVVFSGVSGSGKSSLVFDTIFAEAQRRYLESLSSYARQFIGTMKKPDLDHIEGLSPAVAVSQKAISHNPRSTVGTVTEIYDYLRLLFARVGTPHCIKCNEPIKRVSVEQIVNDVFSKSRNNNNIQILAPVVRGRKGEYLRLLDNIYKKGYTRARIDGQLENLKKQIILEKYQAHNIDILIDEINLSSKEQEKSRVFEAIEQALKLANGLVIVKFNKKEILFNQNLTCAKCSISIQELEPRNFSFNSPYGACETCNGLGTHKYVNAKLIVQDKNETIAGAGILPYSYKSRNHWGSIIEALRKRYGLALNTRIKDFPKKVLDKILYGDETYETLEVKLRNSRYRNKYLMQFRGLVQMLESRYKKTDSEIIRREIEKYMSEKKCESCKGARLNPKALAVKINKKNISQITAMSVKDSQEFFNNLNISDQQIIIADRILKEVKARLEFMADVGLDYLSLNRTAMSLSAGEAQRINLASQIGSNLTGVLYVLDEPSIGLHMRDNKRLLKTLKSLRNRGNTILVIEHDEETMRIADYLVDIGPGAGKLGGKIVAQGNAQKFLKNKNSLTSAYLRGDEKIEIPNNRRTQRRKFITIQGASEHNLKNLTVSIPIGLFTCVTGVSGSGKSTLINDVLFKNLSLHFNKSLVRPGKCQNIAGIKNIKKIIDISQAPIGRTPRSNPVTYTGIFDNIRKLFSSVEYARLNGWGVGRFSFNVKGGRCEACQGQGSTRVEMQFLPDVWLACNVCNGTRYNSETLKVEYKGLNIAQVLDLTVDEALSFFGPLHKIYNGLRTLSEVGLGYIHLGQSAPTLSGGEAQRIKLAKELMRPAQGNSLYILDEPTTGLHFEDIRKLLEVLHKLVNQGNTIIVIEHHMDVIKSADWVIDLGPEGGDAGGRLVCAGSPEEVAKCNKSYTGKFLKGVLKE